MFFGMDSVSPLMDARTRKTAAVILRALASTGQRTVAEAMGISETTVSRMKSDGDLQRMAQLLTALGFKPVPIASKCLTPERAAEIDDYIERLRYWAEIGIRTKTKAEIAMPNDEGDTGLHWGESK